MSDATPGFKHQIPAEIMTPDSVETRIGRLEFFDGLPTVATTRILYENLHFLRAVDVFLNFIPMASLEGLRRGLTGFCAASAHQVVIFDDLMDSNPLFLTGNTDTVYAAAMLDLAADGPTVVEVPPRCGPGRRILPFRHRHGWPRARPRSGRQVPHRAYRLRRRHP